MLRNYFLLGGLLLVGAAGLWWSASKPGKPEALASVQSENEKPTTNRGTGLPPTAVDRAAPSPNGFAPGTTKIKAQTEDTALLPKDERSAVIRRNIDFNYGKAMKGLGLDATGVKKLRELLIERAEAIYIAKDVAMELPHRTPLEVQAAVVATRQQVDDEIRQAFGEESYARIKTMLDAASQLLLQKLEYEPMLETAGIATLDPTQAYRLGAEMLESYGDSNVAARADSADPTTGLTTSDDHLLEKAAAILTPAQLAVFHDMVVGRNLKYAHTKNHN